MFPIALLLSACPQALSDDFVFQRDQQSPDNPALGSEFVPDSNPPLASGSPDAAGSGLDPSDAAVAETQREAGTPEIDPPDASTPDAATADGGSTAEDPALVALRAALIHRYRFEGTGPSVIDSVGTADGVTVGAQLSGGAAVLAGTEPSAPQYIDLPNGLISGLASASFEAWVYWDVDATASTSSWQRIFDFGSNSSTTEGQQGSNAHNLYLAPKSGGVSGKLHFEYRSQNDGDFNVDGPSAMPARVQVQIVAVLDDTASTLTVYQNGLLQGSVYSAAVLSAIPDSNNWLGRSQYDGDPAFQGRILDFRIYAAALTQAQIQLSFDRGPDGDL